MGLPIDRHATFEANAHSAERSAGLAADRNPAGLRSHRRGNRDGVGWRVIDRDREHTFQPPFGDYDKDYPGWQPIRRDFEN